MIHPAVYARVSSEDQAERGTIENQIEFATKYCDLHQLEIVKWYKDDGVTGTLPLEQRPAGRQLIEDAKNGKFDLLLIYRLDRLGRSARVILNAVYELEQHGVKIRSMTEPFDTGDPNGRFLLTILAGVADLERETILERMRYGANRAARAGKWLGGIVPYGYRVNEEGYLEVNEDPLPGMDMSEADVVRLIYRLIADHGYSTIKVADYLNTLGVPPSYVKDGRQVKRGKRKVNTAGIWRPSRIRNMVVNTTYMGLHQYGKRTKKNRDLIIREVPAIVSREVWEKAQQVLRENQLEATRNAKRQYLLRGLIKCGICGLSYQGVAYPSTQNKLKGYYVCNGKIAYHGPLRGKCPSKNVPQEWIENLVWQTCVDFINHPGEAMKELAATMEERKSQKAALEAEKEMILKAAQEKDNEKDSILDLYRKKIIGSLDVERQLQKIAQEKAALQQRAKDIDRQIEAEDSLAHQFRTAEELLADLRAKLQGDPSFEVRREIVKSLVREIIIDTKPGDNGRPQALIFVRYSFSGSLSYSNGVPRTGRDSYCQLKENQQDK
ncbi:recombinase family protein [Neomoorella thermoacetica]|uniref:recombinase family protein n=1 Tax=Neomoorella thermoacetica TaxID=1525 RepID=UPI00324EE05B